jgi:dipeptidyl-peptidase-4
MIVCGMDHTVNPLQSYRMVNALIAAGKDFDLVVIPNADHCKTGAYGELRMSKFFFNKLIQNPGS